MIFDFFMADGPFEVFETVEQNLYYKEHRKPFSRHCLLCRKGQIGCFGC